MKKSKQELLKVVVLGAGGTGLYIADCIERTTDFAFAGFLDDDESKQIHGYEGMPVLGNLSAWKELDSSFYFISSLYDVKKMEYFRSLVESLSIPYRRWVSIVDAKATVCSAVKIGGGSFIGPGSVIEPASVIGKRCALLGNVYVAHHSVLEDFVVCANNVSVAGGVHIGEASYLGANSAIHQYIRIGSLATVGMGAVVLKPIPEGVTVVGNPAKPMKRFSRGQKNE